MRNMAARAIDTVFTGMASVAFFLQNPHFAARANVRKIPITPIWYCSAYLELIPYLSFGIKIYLLTSTIRWFMPPPAKSISGRIVFSSIR